MQSVYCPLSQYPKVSLYLFVYLCKGTPHQVKVVFSFPSRHNLQYNPTHFMPALWRHIQLGSTYKCMFVQNYMVRHTYNLGQIVLENAKNMKL